MRLRVHRMVITSTRNCRHCKLNRLDSVFTTAHSVLLGGTWRNHTTGMWSVKRICSVSCEASALCRDDSALEHTVSRCYPALAVSIHLSLVAQCSALLFESDLRLPLIRCLDFSRRACPALRSDNLFITGPTVNNSRKNLFSPVWTPSPWVTLTYYHRFGKTSQGFS